MKIRSAVHGASVIAGILSLTTALAIGYANHQMDTASYKEQLADQIIKISSQRREVFDRYLAEPRREYLIEWQILYDATVRLLTQQEFAASNEQALLQEMREKNVMMQQRLVQLMALQEQQVSGQEDPGQGGRKRRDLLASLERLRDEVSIGAHRLREISRRGQATAQEVNRYFLPVSIGALLALIAGILLLVRVKIVGRLTRLTEEIAMISRGNLKHKVHMGGGDEISRLAADFQALVDELQKKVADQSILSAIVTYSNEAVISEDLNGRILSWNPGAQRLLGYSAMEMIGQSIHAILPQGHKDDEDALLDRIKRDEVVSAYEVRRLRKDGTDLDVSLMISPIRDASGDIIGASKILRDITEVKQQQYALKSSEEALKKLTDTLELQVRERTAQLEASNEELERFSYAVSHDLRAPLRHLSGFVEMLIKHMGGRLDEKSTHYLDVIHHAARQMGKLIEDLLTFARMGRMELVVTQVSMKAVTYEAMELVAPETMGRDLDFQVADLPDVWGDRQTLLLVMTNLVANAVKFTQKRQHAIISIGTVTDWNHANEVAFYVRDNGVGFDMRYQDKLFGIFQRLHSQSEFEGTGIGLANVQRIIKRHGGRVWARAAPDEGATFYFTLKHLQRPQRG